MTLIPPLLAAALVLLTIGVSGLLFLAWQRNPVTVQQRAGLVYRFVRTVVSRTFATILYPIFTLAVLAGSYALLLPAVISRAVQGREATLSIKLL